MLRDAIEQQTLHERPSGCLFVEGALVFGDQANAIRQDLVRHRLAGELSLAERFPSSKAQGDLPEDADPDDLARYVYALLYGLALQTAGGCASRPTDKESLWRSDFEWRRDWPGLTPNAAARSEGAMVSLGYASSSGILGIE
ncbi:TetR family transcriptional regulator C-terminal domain-containing protein [Pseudomonas coronafaciens]|uniref:TetR family transcriptional regulator C-terminal domain-containing protein n=1 Tax=Pseudomonas coronafaciens TaxID=53409 RepID=UPI00399B946C